jgi:uncharacterized protein
LINMADAAEIGRLGDALLNEKRYPISVVTIRSLAAQGADGYTIERYAAELMQSWRQDDHLRTYGMLLLVAADDRTARIQLGSAWGHAHDDRARKIMDRLILPAFRRGEFSRGILDGVRGFDAMGRQLSLPTNQPWWNPSELIADTLEQVSVGGSGQPWWTPLALLAGGVVLLLGFISFVRSGRRSWAWAAAAFVLGILLSRLLGGGDSAEAGSSGGGATGKW